MDLDVGGEEGEDSVADCLGLELFLVLLLLHSFIRNLNLLFSLKLIYILTIRFLNSYQLPFLSSFKFFLFY